MRELTTYVGVLYAGLNAVSLAAIFLFNYYEPVLGGRWDNAGLGAMLSVPIVIAMGLGYAVSAYARDRRRVPPTHPYLVGAIGAGISGILMFGTSIVEALTPSEWFGVGAVGAYFVVVGSVTPWLTRMRGRHVTGAA